MPTDQRDLCLDAYLSSMEAHIAELKRLNPSIDAELQDALAESREMMGVMALYLRQLKQIEDREDCYCQAA